MTLGFRQVENYYVELEQENHCRDGVGCGDEPGAAVPSPWYVRVPGIALAAVPVGAWLAFVLRDTKV